MPEDHICESDDAVFVFDPDNLDPDHLRAPARTAYWEARRSGVQRIRDESIEPFQWSVPWQTYLWAIDPDKELWLQPTVVRTEVVTRNTYRRDGATFIDVSIPMRFFQGLNRERAQDIYRLIARDTYVWASPSSAGQNRHRCQGACRSMRPRSPHRPEA